jgi:hypothetical protein
VSTSYKAYSYDIDNSPIQVTTVTVTKGRIILEWLDDTYIGALNATSTDGVVYEGAFSFHGYPGQDYHVKLSRYNALNGAILFFGDWWEFDDDPRVP